MPDIFINSELPFQRRNNLERPIDPPEYEDPIELDDQEEEFIITMKDVIIEVNEDGSWDYEDESYDWAKDSGSKIWYGSEPLTEVKVREYTDIVEDVDDILYPNIPSDAGRYKINGEVHLVYYLTNIYAWEEFNDYVYDQDDVEVEFDRSHSFIKDYTVESL